MNIQKRTLPKFVLLNCLTLGIYGAIVSQNVGVEIDALCKGDGEKPRLNYMGAAMIRAIAPLTAMFIAMIIGLVNELHIIFILRLVVFVGLVASITLGLISGIYLEYWWYKQASRMKLNAHRYGMTVKESGTDTFVLRSLPVNLLMIPINVLLLALTVLLPGLIVFLLLNTMSEGTWVFASILTLLFSLPIILFGTELTAGACFSKYFIFKNLNRFADAARNGAQPFDPMNYPYYRAKENGPFAGYMEQPPVGGKGTELTPPPPPAKFGKLIGLKGSCAGYEFELQDNEQVIIGKDAKVSNVVIDPAYKEVSRKHVSVFYDAMRDQYCVVDFSSNGTWADGRRLSLGERAYLSHGTQLKLANEKNIFRLS